MKAIRKLYDWTGSQVHAKHANFMLGMLFFIEAIFFIPTDPMLIIYCIERPAKALWYATIATICSVIGGIAGYAIGYTLWESIGEQIIHNSWINYVLSPERFDYISLRYQENAWFAILTAGFTPVPYKAATLSAGFCKIAIMPFILASIISRGARFFLLAAIIKTWGAPMKEFIDRYFNILVVLLLGIIVISIWLFT